jgi:replicative DNA helicase
VFAIMRLNTMAQKAGDYYRLLVNAHVARQWTDRMADGLERSSTIKSALETMPDVRQECTRLADVLDRASTDVDSGRDTEISAAVESAGTGKPAMGLASGLPSLDAIMRGLRPGEMIVVCGRPSYGKSALGCFIAFSLAVNGFPAVFFSCEMVPRDLWARVIRMAFPLGIQADARQTLLDYLTKLPLSVVDASRLTAGQIAADVERRMASGLKFCVVDYLQIVRPPPMRGATREAEVASISRVFQGLAMRCRLPVMVLAQLNRQAAQGAPRLAHLRESGAIEQDCSVGVCIDRPADQDDGAPVAEAVECRLIVEKNRNGPTGVAECLFHPATGRWEGRHAAGAAPDAKAWYAEGTGG